MRGQRHLQTHLDFRESALKSDRKPDLLLTINRWLAWLAHDFWMDRGHLARCLLLPRFLVSIGVHRTDFWSIPIQNQTGYRRNWYSIWSALWSRLLPIRWKSYQHHYHSQMSFSSRGPYLQCLQLRVQLPHIFPDQQHHEFYRRYVHRQSTRRFLRHPLPCVQKFREYRVQPITDQGFRSVLPD